MPDLICYLHFQNTTKHPIWVQSGLWRQEKKSRVTAYPLLKALPYLPW
jgi:hypothetical protein